MKRIILFVLIISILILTDCFLCSGLISFRLESMNGNYKLKIEVSTLYKTEVFDEPFGRDDLPNKGFLVDENGWMTNEKGQKGEYAYLGYSYEEDAIPNDRYFSNIDRRGKVFDQNYTNVIWQEVSDAPESWDSIKQDAVLLNYLLTTNFYDDDHITAGKTDTGFNLLKLFNIPEGSTDYSEIFRKACVRTVPTKGSTATIELRYNNTNWNTVRIPTIPRIECVMTAEADREAIETGKTASVTVRIDNTHSTWVVADQESKEISLRRFWAGTGARTEAETVTCEDGVCYFTLHNISPNTIIHVWSSVTSHEIEGLGFEGTDEAVATLFIGEITPFGTEGEGNGQEEQFTQPDTQVSLKADSRGSERFDVSRGIPSGETLYANILTSDYLYRLGAQRVSGAVHDTITVYHADEEGNTVTSNESFSRSYSYMEITSLEVYAIKHAVLRNGALPGESINLTPSAAYRVPDVVLVDTENHVSRGSSSYVISSAITPEEVRAVAYSNLPSLSVRNDTLTINGKMIMSANSFHPENLKPERTSPNALYQSGLRIPHAVLNQSYATTGNITYERVYAVNPRGEQEMVFPLEGNPVWVHTPVCLDITLSDDTVHNQKPEPAANMSGLILGRPFTVTLSNQGTHRNIPGYGTRDYSAYVKDRQIRFGFDTYLGPNREGTFLKGDIWHSLGDLGISSNQSLITFYTPTWVDEGIYEVEVRSLATNDSNNGLHIEEQANLSPSHYAAFITEKAEISGRVYDLRVTDIEDPGWESFFRRVRGKPEPSGKVFFTGPYNINGDREAQRKHVLPVMPGKNDMPGYQNWAVKLGYAVRFDIRTIGNYDDRYDYVLIMPTFHYVDKDGKNRQEVDLYYSTPTTPLIMIGSDRDDLTHRMKLDFARRGIPKQEFTDTAGAMYRLRGSMYDYNQEEWEDIFPQIPQNGVTQFRYFKILMNEPVRSYVGPQRIIPEIVGMDRALASVQKWYGEFCLPSNCLAVPKGTDLSKERNMTTSSPVFLKDGYIIVNFRDISVINDEDFDHPSLKYAGGTGNGWSLEGYNTHQNGWELEPGDVMVYYTDKRATDDYYSAGTH